MKERSQLPPPQQKKIERLETSWFRDGLKEGHQEGHQEGLQEGLQKGETLGMIKLARNQLIDRLGTLDSSTDKRLQKLSPEQLFALVRALSNFESAADLNQWLDSQAV
jgi:flagellar biosynthesis/type III secretory pathway protein FliH